MCRISMAVFVRILSTIFTLVFMEQKICLRYFKIQGTYFKICALYFFFSPMWGKHTENQFSIFPLKKGRFPVLVFHFSSRPAQCKTQVTPAAITELFVKDLSRLLPSVGFHTH